MITYFLKISKNFFLERNIMKKHVITDLACESYEADKEKNKKNGIISSLVEIFDYSLIKTEITNETGESITGKKIGKYLTLYAKNVWKYTEAEQGKVVNALSLCISELFDELNLKSPGYLVVGLGNRHISADKLGPLCVDEMTPTHHLKKNKVIFKEFGYDLSLLAPSVIGQSGIESADIVRGVIKSSGASCLILIDSLSTKSLDRLCATFQITNTGLVPASAIAHGRQEISRESTGIPVISIGVPCAICVNSLLSSEANDIPGTKSNINRLDNTLFLTPKDIDIIVPSLSKIIAKAIIKSIKSK